jgi:hypothetical protein
LTDAETTKSDSRLIVIDELLTFGKFLNSSLSYEVGSENGDA